MAALLRQLQISVELADESLRALPGPTDEMVGLCLDHLAHARALAGLIARGRSSCPVGPELPERSAGCPSAGTVGPELPERSVGCPSADRLAGLVGGARKAATEACLAASSADEVEMFGMIAAALAGHEVILRGLDG